MSERSDRRGEIKMDDLATERLTKEVLAGINQINCGAKIELKQGRLELGGWFEGPIKYLVFAAVTALFILKYGGSSDHILKLILS